MYEHRKSASRPEGFCATQNRERSMTGNWQCKSNAIMRRETNKHTYLLVARNRREGTLVLNPKARFLFENAKKLKTNQLASAAPGR
jgi:hypothetical protein